MAALTEVLLHWHALPWHKSAEEGASSFILSKTPPDKNVSDQTADQAKDQVRKQTKGRRSFRPFYLY